MYTLPMEVFVTGIKIAIGDNQVEEINKSRSNTHGSHDQASEASFELSVLIPVTNTATGTTTHGIKAITADD